MLATFPVHERRRVDAAVGAAREAQPAGRASTGTAHRLLFSMAQLIEANAEEPPSWRAATSASRSARPRSRDVRFTAQTWLYYAGWPSKILGTTNPANPGVFTYTLREPLGVVGVITPWNFPMVIASWKLAPALACGNTVVHKPSEEAPLTALRLRELAMEAGIPEEVWHVVCRAGQPGQALVAHPQVDKITFTGSTAVGRQIQRAAPTR